MNRSSKWQGERPSIFEYESYRVFLQDLYLFYKQTKPGFSYRAFSQQAGFSSPNFLKLVMDSQRNLSVSSTQKFIKALQLNKEEASFFECLVNFTQAKKADEKSVYFEKMRKFKKYRQIRSVSSDQYEFYSKWYYSVVRELVTLEGFEEDPAWIAKKVSPSISEREAEEALDLLFRLNLIERNDSNQILQSDSAISSGPEIRSLSAVQFHRQMLARASDSIEDTDPMSRDISSLTLGVKLSQLPEIKQRIYDFRQDLLSQISSDESGNEEVYQLNIQFFPLTNSETRNKSEDAT